MVVTGGDASLEAVLAALPRVYTLDELAAHASSVVVAADRAAASDAPLVVFAFARTNVRRVGRVHAGAEEIAARGITSAVTDGACGFVWTADASRFRIWCREQSSVEITRESLTWGGTSMPTSAIAAVASVAEPGGERRGVAVVTPSRACGRLVLVQSEGDDRGWTIALARALAAWLGVPHIGGGDAWT
jgi:hypothetical protein